MTGANRKSIAKRVGNGALNEVICLLRKEDNYLLSFPPQGGFFVGN